MKLFILRRDTDVTGVSGTGDIAEGVQFNDSTVVLRWRPIRPTSKSSIAVWPDVDSMLEVHGHDGKTWIAWV